MEEGRFVERKKGEKRRGEKLRGGGGKGEADAAPLCMGEHR